MRRSTFIVHRSRFYTFRHPPGFAYIALLVAIIIIGISLGAAGKYWSSVMLRDKEEELLFRGEQYRKAIDLYYFSIPGRREYPQSIDDLLKDPRSPTGKRYLRQKYKDPMTGEDFEEIKHIATKRIIGLRSTSNKECLKQVDFPPTVLVPISAGTYSIPLPIAPKTSESESVASDKMKYSDWLFVSSTLTSTLTTTRTTNLITTVTRT